MKNLHGKVALITGGTKGIGYGIAEALLKQGINVAITSRNKKSAEEAAKKLNGSGNDSVHAIGLEADVRDYASQQQAVEATIKEFGKIDVVVANAGLGHFGSIEDITVDQWNEVIETNLTGAFYSLKKG